MKKKTHQTKNEWRVRDTYEASYYMLKGAELKRVEFSPDGNHYVLFLTGVKPFMRYEWNGWTMTANIRLYAESRKKLKKQIRSLSERGRKPGNNSQQIGGASLFQVSARGQASSVKETS